MIDAAPRGSLWRAEDEALLERLEDEAALAVLYRHHVGPGAERSLPHPRAAGLVAAARKLQGGAEAVAAALRGDVAPLARLVDAPPMSSRPPPMLHHTALYFAQVATTLEGGAPDLAANAWMRSLAAWLALGQERAYLDGLQSAILGADAKKTAKAADLAIPAERVPLEMITDLGRRAESAARDLGPRGRAALLALAWVPDAARIAGVSPEAARDVVRAAERARNAALDAALSVVGEALDDASVRGELPKEGRGVMLRALDVWAWSGNDEAVEQFVADRLATVGWELYRQRDWRGLRQTFDPFRVIIESFARRLEKDPSLIAYAAPCAQMFVFLTDIEDVLPRKMELAERAVKLCPTHRNGRLNLASLLCDEAIHAMKAMMLFTRKEELDRIQALLDRAERLYPQSSELPEAKAMLERLRRGRIAL